MHGKDKILGNHRFSSRGGVGGGGKGGVYSFNGPYGEALLEKNTSGLRYIKGWGFH